MKSRSNFYLSKWYFDLIDQDGNVFIAYTAQIRWRLFAFNYSSFLLRTESKIRNELTWRKQPLPCIEENVIKLLLPNLSIEAEWESKSEPIKMTLLDLGEKFIQWNCITPIGTARVKLGNKILEGLGYAEHLTMTIKPWELPFDELRWGRFISDLNSIIWIDWRRAGNRNWVFLNGSLMADARVTDESISFQGYSLGLDKYAPLREGNLLSTALKRIPKNFSIFPKRILNTYESKWLSRSTLKNNESIIDTGWSIHEVVKWK